MSRGIPSQGRNIQLDNRAVTYGSAIPDSVVDRPQDDRTFNGEGGFGLEISTSQEWPSIGVTISANASGFSRGVLYDSGENLIKNVDISSLTAGDSFTFDDVNLSANTNYLIVLDNNGSSMTHGGSVDSFPYSSSDGNLEIVDGAAVNGSTGDAWNILEVGDVGFN